MPQDGDSELGWQSIAAELQNVEDYFPGDLCRVQPGAETTKQHAAFVIWKLAKPDCYWVLANWFGVVDHLLGLLSCGFTMLWVECCWSVSSGLAVHGRLLMVLNSCSSWAVLSEISLFFAPHTKLETLSVGSGLHPWCYKAWLITIWGSPIVMWGSLERSMMLESLEILTFCWKDEKNCSPNQCGY